MMRLNHKRLHLCLGPGLRRHLGQNTCPFLSFVLHLPDPAAQQTQKSGEKERECPCACRAPVGRWVLRILPPWPRYWGRRSSQHRTSVSGSGDSPSATGTGLRPPGCVSARQHQQGWELVLDAALKHHPKPGNWHLKGQASAICFNKSSR